MKNRFTHNSRLGRHSISAKDRNEVYERDDYTCQYCSQQFGIEKLSIDHLTAVTLNGLHDIRNFVTCCRSCNSRKKNKPLLEFLKGLNIDIKALPIHGDPIIDNEEIPIEIRIIRKRIFDNLRSGNIELKNKAAQQKIEKQFRTDVWNTTSGKYLIESYPNLPGPARIMIPEIKTISKSQEETILLIELAKSATTRNLIGTEIVPGVDINKVLIELLRKSKNESFKKRLEDAITRANKTLRILQSNSK